MKILYSAMFDAEAYPFHELAEKVQVVRTPVEMDEPDSALVLWGGADVDPQYYGHAKSKTCYTSAHRDASEWALMQRAVDLGIPIIGVCRGAQLMCAFSGGHLIQDVTNHAIGRMHEVTTVEGRSFSVNSLHHQMLCGLDKVDHELLAWSKSNLSNHYIIENDRYWFPPNDFKEPEMVWFPRIRGLAVQWHPEAMDDQSEATKYIMEVYNARINA